MNATMNGTTIGHEGWDNDAEEYQGLQRNLEIANLAVCAVLGAMSFALLVGTLFIRLGTNLNTKALPVWGATALFFSFQM